MICFKKSVIGAVSCFLVVACGSESVVNNENQQPDPVVVDIPIAYIKRTLPIDENGANVMTDVSQPYAFVAGAALYVKARASANTEGVNVTDQAFISDEAPEEIPAYDVKDLTVSYDGTRLLFAMRAPEIEGADEDEQPTWNIWQYDLPSTELTRLILSDTLAEQGQDTSPQYLPDGRIVFSSTRQRANQFTLLDEGKPQYSGLDEGRDQEASVLHTMSEFGDDIRQISFNQSHDVDPVVLSSGKIVFSRWDRASSDKNFNLYQVNPDGSGLEILYGMHSHESEQYQVDIEFVDTKELPTGELLTAVRTRESTYLGQDWVSIDTANFIDNYQPSASNPNLVGPAQTSALFEGVTIDGSISRVGTFAAVAPLWDGTSRSLFSWSQCRVYDPEQSVDAEVRRILPCTDDLIADPNIEAAPQLFGIWMYDSAENTQLVVVPPEEGVAMTEIAVMGARPFPDDYIAPDPAPGLVEEKAGIIHIRSVYDFAGEDRANPSLSVVSDPSQTSASDRQAQYLRVVKAVSIPSDDVFDFDNSAFGRSSAQGFKEILGYVPIEPDGSAKFKVPANVPIAFSILNGRGKRITQRHQNWMQVIPGEEKTCNGCHERDSQLPHGRLDAEYPSINQGAETTGLPFPNANPSLFADAGETMAEVRTRIQGLTLPNTDIVFEDIWVDPALTVAEASYAMRYVDLDTQAPVSDSCLSEWTAICRIEINYPLHIQPIFDLDRVWVDETNPAVEEIRTCTSCHNDRDEADVSQVPAGQLDLTDKQSADNNDFLTSYRELMFVDNEQEVVEGALLDRLIPVLDGDGNPVFETDDDGELILDAEGNPIPVMRTVIVINVLSTNGARSSQRFFSVFSEGGAHPNWLSGAEQKLMSEWLDIGGQYYNNPFQVPSN